MKLCPLEQDPSQLTLRRYSGSSSSSSSKHNNIHSAELGSIMDSLANNNNNNNNNNNSTVIKVNERDIIRNTGRPVRVIDLDDSSETIEEKMNSNYQARATAVSMCGGAGAPPQTMAASVCSGGVPILESGLACGSRQQRRIAATTTASVNQINLIDSNYSFNPAAVAAASAAASPSVLSDTLTNAHAPTAGAQITLVNNRCYLCDTPKQEYSLICSYSELICRGCLNYEGPDRIEWLISEARSLKKSSQSYGQQAAKQQPPPPLASSAQLRHQHQHYLPQQQQQQQHASSGFAGAKTSFLPTAHSYQVSSLNERQTSKKSCSPPSKTTTTTTAASATGATGAPHHSCSSSAASQQQQRTNDATNQIHRPASEEQQQQQQQQQMSAHNQLGMLGVYSPPHKEPAGQADQQQRHQHHQLGSVRQAPPASQQERAVHKHQSQAELLNGAIVRDEFCFKNPVCLAANCCPNVSGGGQQQQQQSFPNRFLEATRSSGGGSSISASQPASVNPMSHLRGVSAAAYEHLMRFSLAAVNHHHHQQQQQQQQQSEQAGAPRGCLAEEQQEFVGQLAPAGSQAAGLYPTNSSAAATAAAQAHMSNYYARAANHWRASAVAAAAVSAANRQPAHMEHCGAPGPQPNPLQPHHLAAYMSPAAAAAAATAAYCSAAAAAAQQFGSHQQQYHQQQQQQAAAYHALASQVGTACGRLKLQLNGGGGGDPGATQATNANGGSLISTPIISSSTCAPGALYAQPVAQASAQESPVVPGDSSQKLDFSLRRLLSGTGASAGNASKATAAGQTGAHTQAATAAAAAEGQQQQQQQRAGGQATLQVPRNDNRSPPSRAASEASSDSTLLIAASPEPKKFKLNQEQAEENTADSQARYQRRYDSDSPKIITSDEEEEEPLNGVREPLSGDASGSQAHQTIGKQETKSARSGGAEKLVGDSNCSESSRTTAASTGKRANVPGYRLSPVGSSPLQQTQQPAAAVHEKRPYYRRTDTAAKANTRCPYRMRVSTTNRNTSLTSSGACGSNNKINEIATSNGHSVPMMSSTTATSTTPSSTATSTTTTITDVQQQKRATTDGVGQIEPISPVASNQPVKSGNTQQQQQQQNIYSPLRCLMCDERLEDRHFVQCPSAVAHKFCFACSKSSIESQQVANKALSKTPTDKVFCPSGKMCFLVTEQTPWTFMNSEIETIFRNTSARQHGQGYHKRSIDSRSSNNNNNDTPNSRGSLESSNFHHHHHHHQKQLRGQNRHSLGSNGGETAGGFRKTPGNSDSSGLSSSSSTVPSQGKHDDASQKLSVSSGKIDC